ncbi:hypothetical protein L3Y34_011851 [Caenorhabditis briggsae]|nr:hypothetical protein L3Y34_011851 [Caenorhabditis briggsae]
MPFMFETMENNTSVFGWPVGAQPPASHSHQHHHLHLLHHLLNHQLPMTWAAPNLDMRTDLQIPQFDTVRRNVAAEQERLRSAKRRHD